MRVRNLSCLVGAAALAAGAIFVAATPALAAAPAHDAFAGAVAVGSFPFTTSIDTSEATTDKDDANAKEGCDGVPATDASV